MLPKSHRLNLKKDFKWVGAGRKTETLNFKLMFKAGHNVFPLVGIALNSGIFKKAVLRNKARRISSKAVEAIYQSLPTQLNLVIMPKSGILTTSLTDLVAELKNAQTKFI